MPREAAAVPAYLLAEDYSTGPDGQPLRMLPFRVHFTPGYRGGDFCLSSGDGRNGGGTFLSAALVLSPTWRPDLESAGGAWLVPLLERMAGGEAVPAEEVLRAYKKIHGRKPPREEWQVL